jgi:hypothetical protein
MERATRPVSGRRTDTEANQPLDEKVSGSLSTFIAFFYHTAKLPC